MSEYMKDSRIFNCKERKDDFIEVGKNNVRNGLGIVVEEREDAASVVLSWESVIALRDHLNTLIDSQFPSEDASESTEQPSVAGAE